MINYQPLNLVNEWKLFIYNVKFIWKSLRKPLLGRRINRDTYDFLFFFSWFSLPGTLLFISPFIRYDIFSREACLYFAFVVHVIVRIFGLLLLGRRLQDWGIPQTVVLLLLGGGIWGTHYLGYPLLFDVDKPFTQAGLKGIILNLPQYMQWMAVLGIVGCLIPNNHKSNRFGEPPGWGIILFGRRVSSVNNRYVFSYNPIKDLDGFKEFLSINAYNLYLFFKRALDFRGRSSCEDFFMVGMGILIFQGVFSAHLYLQDWDNIELLVEICMGLHVLLFIPSMSLFTRRLHDCYCSAFWIPFMYVPVLNLFVYAILLFGKSWEIEDFHLAQGERV